MTVSSILATLAVTAVVVLSSSVALQLNSFVVWSGLAGEAFTGRLPL